MTAAPDARHDIAQCALGILGIFGSNPLRRTKAVIIYRRTGNLREGQLLLGHLKIESTVRCLGIGVDDANEILGARNLPADVVGDGLRVAPADRSMSHDRDVPLQRKRKGAAARCVRPLHANEFRRPLSSCRQSGPVLQSVNDSPRAYGPPASTSAWKARSF